jgi:hypothetical protein
MRKRFDVSQVLAFTALWAVAAAAVALARFFVLGFGPPLLLPVATAVAQSLVVWTRTRWAWQWAIASALSVVILQQGVTFLYPALRDGGVASFYAAMIVLNLVSAVPQWLVLRRHVRRHWWWLAARPLDLLVGNGAGRLSAAAPIYVMGADADAVPRLLLVAALSALVDGVVLGALLSRRDPSPASQPEQVPVVRGTGEAISVHALVLGQAGSLAIIILLGLPAMALANDSAPAPLKGFLLLAAIALPLATALGLLVRTRTRGYGLTLSVGVALTVLAPLLPVSGLMLLFAAFMNRDSALFLLATFMFVLIQLFVAVTAFRAARRLRAEDTMAAGAWSAGLGAPIGYAMLVLVGLIAL